MTEKILIDGVDNLKLEHTFECGQCFRWERDGQADAYIGVAQGKVVRMELVGKQLTIENASPEDYDQIWCHYLDQDRDYTALKYAIEAKSPILEEAVNVGYGIRILNQDLWETIASFIISANNNIPRIKGCIEGLAKNFGKEIGKFKGKTYYAFPDLETLARLKESDLEIIRLGYRNRYLLETAKRLAGGELEEIEALRSVKVPHDQVVVRLCKLPGVGPKVANCIALFGLGRTDTFPIDVWMRRVMSQLYGMEGKTDKQMEAQGRKMFGQLAGFVQQYLFYSARKGVDLTKIKL